MTNDTFDGDWIRDKKHGKGIYTFGYDIYSDCRNGDIYEGEWSQDKWHGKGKYTSKDRTYMYGEFRNHKFVTPMN